MFKSPDAAYFFWLASIQQSKRTAYIDMMFPGPYYILLVEEEVAVGARVGKIEGRQLTVDALALGRQFINHTTTE